MRFSFAFLRLDECYGDLYEAAGAATELRKVFLRERLTRTFLDNADIGNPPTCAIPEEVKIIYATSGDRSAFSPPPF
jgi:hypothetical protein